MIDRQRQAEETTDQELQRQEQVKQEVQAEESRLETLKHERASEESKKTEQAAEDLARELAAKDMARSSIALPECRENSMTIVKEGSVAPLIRVPSDGSPGPRRSAARVHRPHSPKVEKTG